MTGAVIAALASALCFAAAATLQQKEAGLQTSTSVADPRLLWRLAHRPVWIVGILADGLSAGLHVLALSLGSIALVQPLGVTGLLFAIPMVAVVRRHRISGRDLLAAIVVLSALVVILRVIPTSGDTGVTGTAVVIWVAVVGLIIAGVATTIGHFVPGRVGGLALAAGAGVAFGLIAVFIRALLLTIGEPYPDGARLTAIIAVVLLIPAGYLMLQNAYRTGHFAACLAVAVVMDPLAAIVAGIPLLGEPMPRETGSTITIVACFLVIAAGITVLVRSPAHLFTIESEDVGLRTEST